MRKILLYILGFIVCLQVPAVCQKPLDLITALKTAKQNNIELSSQNKAVQKAEADGVTASLRPNPILNNQSLQLADASWYFPNTGWSDTRNRQIWWQLTKPLLMPGVRSSRMAVAASQVNMEKHQQTLTENEILKRAADLWIESWLAVRNLNDIRTASKRIEMLGTGVESKTDLLTLQLAMQLFNAEKQVSRSVNELQLFLNIEEKPLIDTSSNLSVIFKQTNLLEGESRNDRADLMSAEESVNAANLNERLQKTLAWPTPELGVIVNPQNTIPYIGFFGTIQLPLFTRNQGEIKKAAILKEEAKEQLVYKRSQLKLEYQLALSSYKNDALNVQKFAEMTVKADADLVITKSQGQGSQKIQLSEEIKNNSEIHLMYNEVIAAYFRSAVELIWASGRLTQIALE